MIRGRIAKFLMLAIIVSMPMSALAQKKFDVYGFMDIGFTKMYMEENNFFQSLHFIGPEPRMTLGNVNMYFDFNPNEYTRTLIELNLNANTYDEQDTMGLNISVSDPAALALSNVVYTGAYAGAYTPVYNAVYAQAFAGALLGGADSITAGAIADGTAASVAASTADSIANDAAASAVNGAKAGYAAASASKNFKRKRKYGGLKIERAWLDIKPNDFVNFRAGRFLTPAGIWNVDHGSPLIITISQPNQTSLIPIFPNAQNGLMIYGRAFLGDHDMAYNVYMSSGRDDDNINNISTAKITDFGVGAHLGFNFDVLDGISIGASGYSGVLKDTRLEQEYVITDYNDIINNVLPLDNYSYTRYTDEESREICIGFDAKLSFKNILLQSEVNLQRNQNHKLNDAETPVNAWYVLGGYEAFINEKLGITPYVFFESLKFENAHLNPVRGLYYFPFNGWNSLAIGINTRLFSNVRLKVEFTRAFLEVLNKPLAPGSTKDNEIVNTMIQNNYKDGDLDMSSVSAQITVAF